MPAGWVKKSLVKKLPGNYCDYRKSRFLIMEKSSKKQAKSVSKVMIKALEGVPVKTITPDRGKEFTDHASVTKVVLLSKTSPALAAGNK